MHDLIVLVADMDTEVAVQTLLTRRRADLGIAEISFEIRRHPDRDPGVRTQAHEFLRSQSRRFRHALVVFDYHGCGREGAPPEAIEAEVETALYRNGWQDRARAVVVCPELEIWAWGSLECLAQVTGLSPRRLCQIADRHGASESGKPHLPKEALKAALRRSGRPWSSALFLELAVCARLDICSDRAFLKLRDALRQWFPE